MNLMKPETQCQGKLLVVCRHMVKYASMTYFSGLFPISNEIMRQYRKTLHFPLPKHAKNNLIFWQLLFGPKDRIYWKDVHLGKNRTS